MNKDHHYLSPKLVGREIGAKAGRGVFAREFIPEGELLIVWGGDIVEREAWQYLTDQQQHLSVLVEDGLYLVSFREGEADWINHSCDPNAWLVGQITVFARRDIQPGEEVCFDYATVDNFPDYTFECGCGSPICRKQFTGNHWKLPELQERYRGHFSPYLERIIAQQQK